MEVFNDAIWRLRRKEKGENMRGNYSRKTDTNQYNPAQIKSILKELGIDIVGETSNDFLCYCPFHSNRHTSSFSVGRENGSFICFNPSCGEAGTLNELVRKTLHKSEFEVLRFIMSKQTESMENFDEMLNDVLEDKPVFEEFSQETIDRLHADLAGNKNARDYLVSRGINEESMEHFWLGYSPSMNMVVTPVHSPDAMPIGIVGRSIEGKAFKNSTNLPKSKTLFNVHRAKKFANVIIVESNFDAIRIHQAGFPNVVATLGGFLSPEQHNILNKYFDRITIMTDADEAGRQLGMSISSKLRNKDILWASYEYGKLYPHNAKDAGDMTEDEIKTCIKNAVTDIEYRSWL